MWSLLSKYSVLLIDTVFILNLQNQPPLLPLVSSGGVFSLLIKFFKRTLTRSFALELLKLSDNYNN